MAHLMRLFSILYLFDIIISFLFTTPPSFPSWDNDMLCISFSALQQLHL
ncbi:hypothetical protein AAZX31_10G155300 [Glycine max]|nr:hypothetical protein GLYMA_10G164400v4 [Glycine max]KAH1138600.1 hypothetical protein GYH30_028204 [Glycine max]